MTGGTVPAFLSMQQLTRRFGDFTAVKNLSLDVAQGEILCVLGPSGCGKTTLLRMIAGFVQPELGSILCDGRDVTRAPPSARNFGVVFQNYALFPHMTALENVAYGLKVRGVSKADRAERARAALDRVGLDHVPDRLPAQLSGGMQQRVALARALVIEPQLLLLDEPLSALDKNLREEMQLELKRLQAEFGVTTILVTHDQEEALTLSSRIAVMQAGEIRQLGGAAEVYQRPASKFVATFLGTTNLMDAEYQDASGATSRATFEGICVKARLPDIIMKPGTPVSLAVRPEALTIDAMAAGLPGVVRDVLFQGHRLVVQFQTDSGKELCSYADPHKFGLSPGARAFARWRPEDAALLID